MLTRRRRCGKRTPDQLQKSGKNDGMNNGVQSQGKGFEGDSCNVPLTVILITYTLTRCLGHSRVNRIGL